MKKLCVVIAFVVLAAFIGLTISYSEDVTLGSPKQVIKSATVARVEIDEINDSRIRYTIRWRDSSDELIVQSFILSGADYDDVMKSNIVAGNVGNNIGVVLRNRILTAIRTKHGL